MRHKFEVKEMIQRNYYLDRLIRNMWNGEIKVITGIRRCGKSVLLFELFDEYLRNHGTDATQIIKIELDQRRYYKGPVDKSKKSAGTHSGSSRIINWEIAKDGILPSA